ncbi:sarcosine oxidase subunit alpha [Cohaesibacter sp. CAU 1516]|uniref:sarcosine oxidase subunit alpha n=1 Tax=Cohaesibacter sp. CAU 1516 TaxID=2576038 RepID=UPI0010FD79D0|nr:sarcosine oxidase subunit alpha [Cohaesibacter sp. CAU 1516]TLP43879.1 sarcosine oxidase subunit alpha [Cohaesibacter sp. CAU 1516]
MSASRIPGYGRIDPDQPIVFTFDGKSYRGRAGDSVASALLANDVHLMARSFKYHRPRGVVTAGSEEPNALMSSSRGPGRTEPNSRATMLEIWDGLTVGSQNCWPSLAFDVGVINDKMARFLAAGFYYKTFMKPKFLWERLYEPVIRAAAGIGVAPKEKDPDHYASRNWHTDVLVVGGGPAGLAAARKAAESGLEVMLVDEHAELGGTLLSEPQAKINGQAAWDWLAKELEELAALGVKLMSRTTAIGYFNDNMMGLCQRLSDHLQQPDPDLPRECMWRVRASQIILAQGAIEKPLVFHGNDRPGVMLAGAAQTYLNRFGVLVGQKPVIMTSHDSAYYAAFDLADAGAAIQAIIDTRAEIPAALEAQAGSRNIRLCKGHVVTAVDGKNQVAGVAFNPLKGDRVGAAERIACDAVLMCGGWTPSLQLFSHTGGSIRWDETRAVYLPDRTTQDCQIAGACGGHWGLQAAFDDGLAAGQRAAGAFGKASDSDSLTIEGDRIGSGISHRELPNNLDSVKQRAFVDFQSDVTAKDLRLAVREGMKSVEHVKRYTTAGMATDQGKLYNLNGLAIIADAQNKSQPEIGLTTFRPPYTPITFGTYAGHHGGKHFEVTRRTPIDGWAEQNGAMFEPVSQWRRAWYFPKAGESMDEAVARECKATRASVGMFDASTLGKIEVVGPDAVEFMNRLYTNPWTKLAPGRCRYGLLLGDDGFVRDDGVIGRLAEDRFHVTTTTGGAARVLNMMEDYLQTEWGDLKVWLTSTTEQWATIALNGPNARKLLAPFVEGLDIANEAFPHMSVGECTVAGFPARLFRLSFTGELGFEVNVPAQHGLALWQTLHQAGKALDLCVYGTETMHVLRAEKGFIIVGQDTDGTVTPFDLGMGWAVAKKKPDFVGMRGLARPDLVAEGRKQLVGLLTDDAATKLEEGAQIVLDPSEPLPMTMVGHVTSSYHSTTIGRPIALALLQDGRKRIGEQVHIPMPDGVITATVRDTLFFDPDGSRQKM